MKKINLQYQKCGSIWGTVEASNKKEGLAAKAKPSLCYIESFLCAS
jgi:hypothetical protein